MATEEYYGFTNDLILEWVMSRKENCLAVIQAVLPDLNITGLVGHENQHEINHLGKQRQSRFDVVVHDNQGRYYDIEMQVADEKDLGKRMRYYQSQIDKETLRTHEDFRQLRPSYVIFLCAFDPFGVGLRRYEFGHFERDHREIELKTASSEIIINATGTNGEINPDLQAIIDVMNQRRDNHSGLAKRLVKEIDGYNADPERKRQIMELAMKLKDAEMMGEEKGHQKGMQEGLQKGVSETITELIKTAKKSGADQDTIFNFAKGAAHGKLSDAEINQLIDQQG